MENRTINIATVEEVAKGLKQFQKEIVFVDGAVVSLYTDDPAADEIRPTKDIDLTLSAPCFLATKFEAFNNRGGDYRWSHDLEDIITY